jgi:hypothetical protein
MVDSIVLQRKSTDHSWLLPSLAVKMWKVDADGKPIIPDGDPDPVLVKPLWSNLSINPLKVN